MLQVTLAIYVAASIGCALAPSIETLIVLRGVQAFGVAAAPVLARAIVRDLYSGARAGRELSRMGTIMALAPAIAPSLGGLLQTLMGWQANFYVMAAFGLYAFAMVTLLLPETLERPAPRNDIAVVDPAPLRRSSCGIAASCCTWRSCRRATADCSPGFRDRRSRCRRFTANRRLRSGSTFAGSTLGFLCGTLIAAKLVEPVWA